MSRTCDQWSKWGVKTIRLLPAVLSQVLDIDSKQSTTMPDPPRVAHARPRPPTERERLIHQICTAHLSQQAAALREQMSELLADADDSDEEASSASSDSSSGDSGNPMSRVPDPANFLAKIWMRFSCKAVCDIQGTCVLNPGEPLPH